MEKINIAELLKDCPKGMELDCTMYNKVTLLSVDDRKNITFPIIVAREDGNNIALTKYGKYVNADFAKCIIFPKGKTTWEGFQGPFKDGDVVATKNGLYIGIIKAENGMQRYAYVAINEMNNLNKDISYVFDRLATEEEKAKLFKAIKDNGYKWNSETKTLEKLPRFKVGDRIKYIYLDRKVAKVVKIHDKKYELDNGKFIEFQDENAYEISYNKFDINTLKPFDKVLFRMHDKDTWRNGFYSFYKHNHHFVSSLIITRQCIPYEGNEHLLGKTDNCNEYYKTWEK